MKKFLLCFYVLFSVLHQAAVIGAPSEEKAKNIVTIKTINELPLDYSNPDETLFFFDVDDTLLDFPHMLGSRAWRKYIQQATKGLEENWHDLFSLFLTQNLPVNTVELATRQITQDLQEKGYLVCGLTSRERTMWYDTRAAGVDALTIDQLRTVGIAFDGDTLMRAYPLLTEYSEYFAGVFFSNTDLKGDYLKKLFAKGKKPKMIIFVDDKLSQIESVDKALTELGIDHMCYWYVATEEKTNRFDPLIANIELFYFLQSKTILSDEEAAMIAKEYPERKAHDYLQATLSLQ